jgi:hypothetical protein
MAAALSSVELGMVRIGTRRASARGKGASEGSSMRPEGVALRTRLMATSSAGGTESFFTWLARGSVEGNEGSSKRCLARGVSAEVEGGSERGTALFFPAERGLLCCLARGVSSAVEGGSEARTGGRSEKAPTRLAAGVSWSVSGAFSA